MDESWQISRDKAIQQRDEARQRLQELEEREQKLREIYKAAASLVWITHRGETRLADWNENQVPGERLLGLLQDALSTPEAECVCGQPQCITCTPEAEPPEEKQP